MIASRHGFAHPCRNRKGLSPPYAILFLALAGGSLKSCRHGDPMKAAGRLPLGTGHARFEPIRQVVATTGRQRGQDSLEQ